MNEKAQEVSVSSQKVLKVSHRTMSQSTLPSQQRSLHVDDDGLRRSLTPTSGHLRVTSDADDELSPTDSKRKQSVPPRTRTLPSAHRRS